MTLLRYILCIIVDQYGVYGSTKNFHILSFKYKWRTVFKQTKTLS